MWDSRPNKMEIKDGVHSTRQRSIVKLSPARPSSIRHLREHSLIGRRCRRLRAMEWWCSSRDPAKLQWTGQRLCTLGSRRHPWPCWSRLHRAILVQLPTDLWSDSNNVQMLHIKHLRRRRQRPRHIWTDMRHQTRTMNSGESWPSWLRKQAKLMPLMLEETLATIMGQPHRSICALLRLRKIKSVMCEAMVEFLKKWMVFLRERFVVLSSANTLWKADQWVPFCSQILPLREDAWLPKPITTWDHLKQLDQAPNALKKMSRSTPPHF